MDKKYKNKIKRNTFIFLIITVSFLGFIIFPRDAKADEVYSMWTSDTTPLIKGTVIEPDSDVFVTVFGYEPREATVVGTNWTLQFDEVLAPTIYPVGAAATEGGDIISDPAFIFLSETTPLEFYFEFEPEEEAFMVSLLTFPLEYTVTSDEDNFSITFAAGTEVTKAGGGAFNLVEWYIEGVEPTNENILVELRFGVPNLQLNFSEAVNVTFDVGNEYNGRTLNIFTRSDNGDGSDDGWEPMEVSCAVINGSCSFSTSHASYFGITEYTSLADDEEVEVENIKSSTGMNSLTVTWKTDRRADSKVKFGTSKNNLKNIKKENGKKKKHKLTLKNLDPGTKYYFKVYSKRGDNEDHSRIYSAKTKTLAAGNSNAGTGMISNPRVVYAAYNGDAKPNVCSYAVENGDNLWSIAKKVYGDATAYTLIIEANKAKYPNIASKLSLGQELSFNCQ